MLNWAASAAAAMLTIMVPLQSYWKQGFRDTLAGGPMAIVESLLHPSKHIKMRAECPVNAFIPIAPSCYRIL
jgi:hypothetical protein